MSTRHVMTAVVPTRNSARTLAGCLDSIRAQTLPNVRIVVVDNSSSDATRRISRERAHDVLIAGPERSAQRNIGWRYTPCSDYVAFIDSDMILEPEVLAQAAAVLDNRLEVGGVIVPETAFGAGFFASCRGLEKQLYVGDERVEALRVVRTRLLESTGGYDERLTAFEDWDLHDRVVASGYKVGRTTAGIWHDEGHLSLRTAFAKKRYYGRWLRSARAHGRPPRPLVSRIFVRHPGLLARSPRRAFGLVVLKAVECAGLLAGAWSSHRERPTS